jgi:ATP-dependent RNA helicase DeaD
VAVAPAPSSAGARNETPRGRSDDPRKRAAEPRRGPRGEGPKRGAPVASYASWEPPEEADDERPILADEDDTTSPLPRFTVEGEAPPKPAERATRPDRAPPRDRAPRAERGDRDEAPPGFVQLFVNVGKREGVRGDDLQKLLSEKGIPEADAGRIRVRDRMSFVAVKKEVVEKVIGALNGLVLGGRTVVAELARGRS